MWSGPRNISTTMMRSFEARGDCAVIDEPFYACYLRASGADHPCRDETLRAMPSDWAEVARALNGPIPAGKPILFAKHIAYHYPDELPLDWLDGHRSFILIRDPASMIASYARKYDDITPILGSFRVARRIHAFETARGRPCPVVDAADILARPARVLGALCAALGIPYLDEMMSWPAGGRPSDGPWSRHWYDAVNASTGFRTPVEKPDPPESRLADLAAVCAPDYRFFRNFRLQVD